jgi:hypothetical protein
MKRLLRRVDARSCEGAAAVASTNGFQVPIATDRQRLAELDALRAELSDGIALAIAPTTAMRSVRSSFPRAATSD